MQIENSYQEASDYEVFVVNITWNTKQTFGKFASKKDFSNALPTSFTYSLPANILAKKHSKNFNDIVETFTYNLLANRFNHIAYHCQIFLPLD